MRWEIAQLGKLCEEQPKIVEEALAALQTYHPEVWRRIVIGGYLDRQINLSKAAELIGLTRLELQQQFVKQGIPVYVLSEDEVQAEVAVLRQRPQAV
jgi:predicted HTH domain antitoxin